ncbi:hypothetical protein BDV12DRAFT_169701 [Aspergillus spectabilis]
MQNQEKVFTFVANNSSGLPRARKQTRRACEFCRKRKRRCTHGSRLASQSLATQSRLTVSTDDTPSLELPIDQTLCSGDRIDGESWFVGNMDPEGAFLIAARPASDSKEIRQHDLGVWLPAGNAYLQLPVKRRRSSVISYPDPLISSLLREQCLNVLPSPDDMAALLRIYMENIHPIFPILDYHAYQSMTATSPEKILLSQSICIAVSKDRSAKQHLHLPAVHTSHPDFSQSLSGALSTLVALGLVQDKLVLVQALSLTSLFTQFSGDRQEPAELLSRAICHAHTLGLHHHCYSSPQQEQISTRLFCCLYALDILNSACLGRPVQLHRRDFGRDLSASIAAQDSCFQLFLRTIQLMDRVIEIYRPGENGTWKGVFPSFQDLLEEPDTSDIPMHLVATIEVLYHAVAILSCHSTNLHGISRTRSSESNIRQSLSASRVTYIVGEEFHNQLSLFPFIPYTVALALRASYHSLHQSKAPIFRERAQKQLVANCRILRELGDEFYSASLMADLGDRLIKEIAKQQGGNRGDEREQEYRLGDDTSSGDTVNFWIQGTSTLDSNSTEARAQDIGLPDPMSFFGIFDNFENEIGAFGGMATV